MKPTTAGLGHLSAPIYFYIANRPPLEFYQQLEHIHSLAPNEIASIAEQTGNHWRKVFNVFAKLVFQQHSSHFNTWQEYRDQLLLQQHGHHCMLFSSIDQHLEKKDKVHIIIGKTYAQQLGWADKCYWLNQDFAINEEYRVIICPYFDYRQLSNIKITQLIQLISQINDQYSN